MAQVRQQIGLPILFAVCAISFFLLITPSLAQSAPYLGRWSENPAWCANTTHSSDEMPITITPREIETFASHCRILSVKHERDRQTWRIRTSCRDEGQTEKEQRTPVTFVLLLDGDRLALRDDTGVQNFTRCKR